MGFLHPAWPLEDSPGPVRTPEIMKYAESRWRTAARRQTLWYAMEKAFATAGGGLNRGALVWQ